MEAVSKWLFFGCLPTPFLLALYPCFTLKCIGGFVVYLNTIGEALHKVVRAFHFALLWLGVRLLGISLDLNQGFSTGTLGPSWGPRSGSPGATSSGLY